MPDKMVTFDKTQIKNPANRRTFMLIIEDTELETGSGLLGIATDVRIFGPKLEIDEATNMIKNPSPACLAFDAVWRGLRAHTKAGGLSMSMEEIESWAESEGGLKKSTSE